MPSTVVVEVEFKSLQFPSLMVAVVVVVDGPTYGMFCVMVQLHVFDLLHPATANNAIVAIIINTFFILL